MCNFFDVKRAEVDITTLVLVVSTAAITLLIGFVLMGSMEEASLPLISTSVLSTSGDVVLTGFGNAANYLALGLFVMAAVFIVGILGGILGKGE